jgi:hypothetical protein
MEQEKREFQACRPKGLGSHPETYKIVQCKWISLMMVAYETKQMPPAVAYHQLPLVQHILCASSAWPSHATCVKKNGMYYMKLLLENFLPALSLVTTGM